MYTITSLFCVVYRWNRAHVWPHPNMMLEDITHLSWHPWQTVVAHVVLTMFWAGGCWEEIWQLRAGYALLHSSSSYLIVKCYSLVLLSNLALLSSSSTFLLLFFACVSAMLLNGLVWPQLRSWAFESPLISWHPFSSPIKSSDFKESEKMISSCNHISI